MLGLTVDWQLDSVSLKSITGWSIPWAPLGRRNRSKIILPAPCSLIPVTWAVFAQGSWHFDEQWSLRYIGSEDFLASSGLDTFIVYGTWSQSFKAGGFIALGEGFQPLESEEVTNYEVGVKLDALDNRLRFNAAAYDMEYDNMQITITRQLDEFTTAPAIANAGQATMAGLEAELSFMPTANWFFQLSANYIDAQYDEFDDIIRDPNSGEFLPGDRSHEDFAYLPETTLSVIGQYSWDTDLRRASDLLLLAGSFEMKRVVYLALLLIGVSLRFYVGRFTAPPAGASGEDVRPELAQLSSTRAWYRLMDVLQTAGDEVIRSGDWMSRMPLNAILACSVSCRIPRVCPSTAIPRGR